MKKQSDEINYLFKNTLIYDKFLLALAYTIILLTGITFSYFYIRILLKNEGITRPSFRVKIN